LSLVFSPVIFGSTLAEKLIRRSQIILSAVVVALTVFAFLFFALMFGVTVDRLVLFLAETNMGIIKLTTASTPSVNKIFFL